MPWEETDQYIRSGHKSPGETCRTITISDEQGIKAIYCKYGDGWAIQSYLFAKAKGWTMSKAKSWFKAHKEEVEEQVGVVSPPAPSKTVTPIPDKCYCRNCGYVLENPSEHCVDISCPECGAEHMYRHKSPTEDLYESIHADFVKVLSDFIRIFGGVEGRRKFDDMVASYGLDIEKPYSNQAQIKECWGSVCEAYNWAKPLIKYLREDKEAKYWKVRALTANVSMGPARADYTDLRELERAAPTLTWRPLNLNHDPSKMLPFPDNRVDWAEYEDSAVECIIRIHNSQTGVQQALENGDIVNPSIEGEPRGGYRTKDGRKVPKWYNFTALALLEKGVTLPGVPATYGFEPLFLNESLGRSLAESLSMENEREKETEMSQTEKGIKEYSKAAKDTPWDLNRADYSLEQLRYASAVVTGDGETKADFRLPHHLPGDGKTHGGTLVWRGVVAAAAVLRGGRGGVSLGSEDKAKAMRHIAAHYGEFDETAPWKEDLKEEKGLYGIDVCGQCISFTDLSDTTVTKPAVTGEATDAEVSISKGSIGPGVGRCSITEKLVRKNDSACTDARPREQATDLDRTKENIGEMVMKDKINELEEKVLRAEQAKSREIEDHVKTKMDLTEASDKITRVTQELAVEQNKNVRIRENVRDLSGKLEIALNRIPELEVRLVSAEGDLIFYKEAVKSAEEKFAVQKKDLAEAKDDLTRTLTKMNEESTKRATAVQEAINAEREKGRLSREVAELTERISELTREVSDTALIRAESARSNLSSQKLIKELREKDEEKTKAIRELKRRVSKMPKEIVIE